MEMNKLDVLIKLKKRFEEQLHGLKKGEKEFNSKIAELEEQYDQLKNNDSFDNKEQLLDLIHHSIQFEEARLENFLSQKSDHENKLNRNLYLVTKSIASILSRYPYGSLRIG